jgi:hypothetical protein
MARFESNPIPNVYSTQQKCVACDGRNQFGPLFMARRIPGRGDGPRYVKRTAEREFPLPSAPPPRVMGSILDADRFKLRFGPYPRYGPLGNPGGDYGLSEPLPNCKGKRQGFIGISSATTATIGHSPVPMPPPGALLNLPRIKCRRTRTSTRKEREQMAKPSKPAPKPGRPGGPPAHQPKPSPVHTPKPSPTHQPKPSPARQPKPVRPR